MKMHTFFPSSFASSSRTCWPSFKIPQCINGQAKQTTWGLLASLPALRLADHTLGPVASKKPGSGFKWLRSRLSNTKKGLLLRAVKFQGQVSFLKRNPSVIFYYCISICISTQGCTLMDFVLNMYRRAAPLVTHKVNHSHQLYTVYPGSVFSVCQELSHTWQAVTHG